MSHHPHLTRHPRWGFLFFTAFFFIFFVIKLAADFRGKQLTRQTPRGVAYIYIFISIVWGIDSSSSSCSPPLFSIQCWICKTFPSTRATNRQPLNACCHIQSSVPAVLLLSWRVRSKKKKKHHLTTPTNTPSHSLTNKQKKKE